MLHLWKYFIFMATLFEGIIRTVCEDSGLPIYHTDSCNETGRKAVTCEDGYIIKIVDVRLMPNNYTSQELEDVARLCNGLNSCSFVDLRKQLFYYCKDFPKKQVYTSFQCIPASMNPVCRTNICSEDNPNIRCRKGMLFHLLEARCFSMKQECPKEVYTRIYRSCEGRQGCSLPILRAAIPQTICLDDVYRQQNLYIDFICVDEDVFSSNCIGDYVKQEPRFGILRNPNYPDNPLGNKNGCYWVIYPQKDTNDEITVFVHEAFPVEDPEVCDYQYLQVQYTLCETGQQTIDKFCDASRMNIRIRSCGTVYVMHYKFPAGEDKGNRFLVSYSVKSPDATTEPYTQYASECENSNPVYLSARYTLPAHTTAPSPVYIKPSQEKSLLPEELPINDSNVGVPDDEKPTEETKKDTDSQSFDPWRVVIVNIFLGLLIVALILALSFVCYRYVKIGRERKRELATKSETVTTLDDKQSTEMQLVSPDDTISPLSDNKLVSSRESLNSEGEQDKSAYETTIFHFNRPHSHLEDEIVFCETGSGVSSFLPHPPLRRHNGKQQNAESAYSSLDDVQEDAGDYSEIKDDHCTSSTTHSIKQPSTACAQLVKQVSVDDDRKNALHGDQACTNKLDRISVDGGDYAVINKHNSQRIQKHNHNYTDHNHSVIDRRVASPSAYFVHAVPEETYICENNKPTTMHLIPEHDCLIHKIPPPPPPPLRQISDSQSSISTYSSKQADV